MTLIVPDKTTQKFPIQRLRSVCVCSVNRCEQLPWGIRNGTVAFFLHISLTLSVGKQSAVSHLLVCFVFSPVHSAIQCSSACKCRFPLFLHTSMQNSKGTVCFRRWIGWQLFSLPVSVFSDVYCLAFQSCNTVLRCIQHTLLCLGNAAERNKIIQIHLFFPPAVTFLWRRIMSVFYSDYFNDRIKAVSFSPVTGKHSSPPEPFMYT